MPIRPASGVITQGFSSAHQAVDIANNAGTPIVAPHRGTVTISGNLGDCGLAIQIEGGQFVSRLCHQSKNHVPKGVIVEEGQHVGDMGSTGKSSGPHVHWVLWDNGARVDPSKYNNQGGNMPDFSQEANDRQAALVTIGKEVSVDYKNLNNVKDIVGNIKTLYRLIDEKDKKIDELLNKPSDEFEKLPFETYKKKG